MHRSTGQFQLKNSVKILSILTLLGCGMLAVAGLNEFSKIQTHYSTTQFLPKDNPAVLADHEILHHFHLQNLPTFIGIIQMSQKESGTWLTQARIKRLETLTTTLERNPNVHRVINLTNVTGLTDTHGAIRVGHILSLTPNSLWRELTFSNPLITPILISRDARTLVVISQLSSTDVGVLKNYVPSFQSKMRSAFPNSIIEVGGIPAIQTSLEGLLSHELRNFILLSLLGCALTLLLLFRTLSTIFIPLLLTALSNAIVIGAMAKLGIPFTVLSSTIPILIFIDVMSISIHLMLRVSENSQLHPNDTKLRIIFRSSASVWLPNLLGSLTTCIGFLTLMLENVPLIRDYGASVSIAIMTSWLITSVTLIPLLLLFPIPEPREWFRKPARWELWILERSRTVLLTVVLGCAFLIGVGWHLNWKAKLFNDLPRGQEARQATEQIDRSLGGAVPLEIVIHENKSDAWTNPVRLNKLDHLLHSLRKFSGVGTALSIPDFLRSSHLTGTNALPKTRSAVAETYFLYSLSSRDPVRNYLTGNGQDARIEMRLHDLPSNRALALIDKIKTLASQSFLSARVQVSGPALTIHELDNKLSIELIFGFWQALLGIALVLALVFRSARWALVACIPNLISPIALLGFLAMTRIPIKPGVAIIFSIALGLAFNNTVYILNRLRLLLKQTRSLPVAQTFLLEGGPCLVSTLIVMVGFSVFLLSYFTLNQIFGACMLVSIFAGAIGDLVFLPALLKQYPRLLGRRPNLSEPEQTEEQKVEEQVEEKTAWDKAIAASIVAICITSLPFSRPAEAHVTNRAERLLKQTLHHLDCKDEVDSVKMTIIEADGSRKVRQIQIKRKGSAKNQRVMARLTSPPDLRGLAFLSIINKRGENQWIYLPSTKQTRRVVGAGGSENGILGSELTYEDLNPAAIRTANVRLVKTEIIKGFKINLLEIGLQKGKSKYDHALMWMDSTQNLPLQIKYYDHQLRPVKLVSFHNYHEYGRVWRAQKIDVTNLRTKRGTDVQITSARINVGLTNADLSVHKLSDN